MNGIKIILYLMVIMAPFSTSAKSQSQEENWKWASTNDRGCVPVAALKFRGHAMTPEYTLSILPECMIAPAGLEEKYGILIIMCDQKDGAPLSLHYYAKTMRSCRTIPLVHKRMMELIQDMKKHPDKYGTQ